MSAQHILYYKLPDGTLTPLLDSARKYIPATAFPAATRVDLSITLEPPRRDADPPKPYVMMFLQNDGSYGLSPPKVCIPISWLWGLQS